MDPLWLLLIGLATVVGCILGLRLHAFLALLLAALAVGILTPRSALETYAKEKKMSAAAAAQFAEQPLARRITTEFGNTCGRIGVLIALASIIGKCLLESGAADRIVRSAIRVVGAARAPQAFVGSGFLLAIPVFFDTVFYLLIPIAKALRVRTGRNYGLYVGGITAGGTMAHSLVPPTPGPLFVADALRVDIGIMMLGGIVVGLGTSFAGYLYSLWLARRLEVPLRDTKDVSVAELEEITRRDDSRLPPLWLSVLPIALPIVLIGGHAALDLAFKTDASAAQLLGITGFLGDSNIALVVAAALAGGLMVRYRRSDAPPVGESLQDALAGAGLIILITSAGGAFGATLQQTGISSRIGALAAEYQVGILPLAWGVTALVRTAQGSATVAMITAVGIISLAFDPASLPFHPVYVALAIGCGSKPFPWMNDSGFWIINRLSGMTVGETLRTFSFQLCCMGIAGLFLTMALARLFPLV